MKPDEVSAAAGVAQAAIGLLTLITTIAITVFVYIGTRAIARIEHDRGIRDAWNSLDALALSDPALLRVAEDLLPGPGSPTGSSCKAARRKWFAYMALNVLSSMYNGATRGLTRSRPDALMTCEYHIAMLVAHDDVYALTQEGYSGPFAAFCRGIREKQIAAAAGSGSSSS